MRLFSSGSEKEENEEKKSKNKDKEHKRRQNSFFREDREHRTSLLESSTSVPKDGFDKEDNDEYSMLAPNKKKVKKRKSSSMEQEEAFDSPYNQLYFQNFIMFLEELIKTEYPKKYEMEEEKQPEFELQIEEKNIE